MTYDPRTDKTKTMAGRFIAWDEDPEPCEAWPTGSAFLDYLTGVGGIPKGRVVMTYGPESSGKSTLALQTAAHVWHTLGIPSVYADFEDALDFRYAKALGLTPQSLLLEQPRTIEDYIAGLKVMIAKRANIALSIVDSVAAAPSEAEFSATVGEDQRASAMNRARIWTQNMPLITGDLAKSGITLFLVNQTRTFIDASGSFVPAGVKALQPKVTVPGGRGLKFAASLMVEFEASSEVKEPRINPLTLEEEKVAIGKNVWLRVRKNKVAPPPWRSVKLQIRDGQGFDDGVNLLEFALTHKLVEKGTLGRFTFPSAIFGFEEDWVVAAQDGVPGETLAAAAIRGNDHVRNVLTEHLYRTLAAEPARGVESDESPYELES